MQSGLIDKQIEYYRARAGEYDQWFLRAGKYDCGKELNERWFEEVKEVATELSKFKPQGEVLELACGTGWWTQQLVEYAVTMTAIDASPEVILINQTRLEKYKNKINYQIADIFKWKPAKQYDVIFFSFWLSHVPSEYFDLFWKSVISALKPNGRIFFIDSIAASIPNSCSARNRNKSIQTRHLNDGRSFEIVKIYYHPEQLTKLLSNLGLCATIKQTERYFLYGAIDSIKRIASGNM